MKKILTLFTLFFWFCSGLSAQEIVTDRPDQTESSTTIPANSFQIEAGILSGGDETEKLWLAPTILFRYGITKGVELRLVEQLTGVRDKAASADHFGLSDVEVGAKFQLLKQENVNSEIAFISHLLIPTGPAELSNSRFGSINKFALSHSLNKRIGVGYNLGYNYLGADNGTLTWSLAFGADLSEKLGLYLETYGEAVDFAEWYHNFDTGITWLIRENLQLDISYGTGLNQVMNYFSLGCSWNLMLPGKH